MAAIKWAKKRICVLLAGFLVLSSSFGISEPFPGRPDSFPRRIWAACDFEEQRQEIVWIGEKETVNIPDYPGNNTAGKAKRYGEAATHILPVHLMTPLRMNSDNGIYFRYFSQSVSEVGVEFHTSNGMMAYIAFTPDAGKWTEVWSEIRLKPDADPATDSILNDIVLTAEPADNTVEPVFIVDDLICFSNDPSLPDVPEEPFPHRVFGVWNFDVFDDYHPWTKDHYAVITTDDRLPEKWGTAHSVKHPRNDYQWIRLIIEPLQAVGVCTKLRFRYLLNNAPMLQIMIFDATMQDNRTVRIDKPILGAWTTADVNFTRDGVWNGGSKEPFSPGNRVDDLFFFPGFTAEEDNELLLDDVVLYDSGSCQ